MITPLRSARGLLAWALLSGAWFATPSAPALPKQLAPPNQSCSALLENIQDSLSEETVAVLKFLSRPPGSRAEIKLVRSFLSLEKKRKRLIKLIESQRATDKEADSAANLSPDKATLIRLDHAFVAKLLTWRTGTSATLSDQTKDPELRERALNNFMKASRFLLEQSLKGQGMTLDFVGALHQLHQNGKISKTAKIQFRTNEVALSDYRGAMVAARDVPAAMNALVKWYNDEIKKDFDKQMPPIELAARFYQIFISIHPFDDANGRTGRDLMDFVLLSHGWPPAIFSGASIEMSAISYYYLNHPRETARLMKPEDLSLIVAEAVNTALDKLIEAHQADR